MLDQLSTDEVMYKSTAYCNVVIVSPEGQIENSGGTRQGGETGQSGRT